MQDLVEGGLAPKPLQRGPDAGPSSPCYLMRSPPSAMRRNGIDMSGRRPLIKGYFAAVRLIVGAVMSSACLMRVMTPVGALAGSGAAPSMGSDTTVVAVSASYSLSCWSWFCSAGFERPGQCPV